MNKYVIELRPDCKVVQQICESNGQVCIGARSIQYLEELNSDYINEHFSDLQDTAYRKGLEEGKKATWGLVADASSAEYQRGLEEGKAVNDKGCKGCKYQANRELTCPCSECANNYKNQWTAKSDKIEVGDEVEVTENGIKFFVTKIYEEDGTVGGFNKDGEVRYWSLSLVKPTGRRFDIDKILEAMRI